jgi:hypothetical protein
LQVLLIDLMIFSHPIQLPISPTHTKKMWK